MIIKRIDDCEEFIANDGCYIRELIHPKNDPVVLPYSLAIARVEPGKQSYAHVLRQEEVYLIMQGLGLMHVDDEVREVREGDAIVIPKEQEQWIENTGSTALVFAAIVSPPWNADDDVRSDTGS